MKCASCEVPIAIPDFLHESLEALFQVYSVCCFACAPSYTQRVIQHVVIVAPALAN